MSSYVEFNLKKIDEALDQFQAYRASTIFIDNIGAILKQDDDGDCTRRVVEKISDQNQMVGYNLANDIYRFQFMKEHEYPVLKDQNTVKEDMLTLMAKNVGGFIKLSDRITKTLWLYNRVPEEFDQKNRFQSILKDSLEKVDDLEERVELGWQIYNSAAVAEDKKFIESIASVRNWASKEIEYRANATTFGPKKHGFGDHTLQQRNFKL